MSNGCYTYCRNVYRQKSWWSKLLALVVVVFYFVALALTYDQPYLWLTLTFAVILCLATLACSRDDPIIAFRRGGPTPRSSVADNSRDAPVEIWVTDVPPSYSFVMANATPPPSYGSAIIKFPAVAEAAEKLKNEGLGNPSSTPMLKRVLDPSRFRSISRQVSEIGRLSRQVSESGIGRLSQQSSMNSPDGLDDGNDDWESGIVIIVPPRARRTISQSSDTTRSSKAQMGQAVDLNDEGAESLSVSLTEDRSEPTEQKELRGEEILPQVFTCGDNATTVIVVQVTDWDGIRETNLTPSNDSDEKPATSEMKAEIS